jgi:hypothetical protein
MPQAGIPWFDEDQGLKKRETWSKGLIDEVLSTGVLE